MAVGVEDAGLMRTERDLTVYANCPHYTPHVVSHGRMHLLEVSVVPEDLVRYWKQRVQERPQHWPFNAIAAGVI